jgi:hypothetical protein
MPHDFKKEVVRVRVEEELFANIEEVDLAGERLLRNDRIKDGHEMTTHANSIQWHNSGISLAVAEGVRGTI